MVWLDTIYTMEFLVAIGTHTYTLGSFGFNSLISFPDCRSEIELLCRRINVMEFNYVFIRNPTFLTWYFQLIDELLFLRNRFVNAIFSLFRISVMNSNIMIILPRIIAFMLYFFFVCYIYQSLYKCCFRS